MHYYQFNIGDYQSHTAHLSEIEDLAYRRLLDWYYLHESPIPLDVEEVGRQIRMRSHTESIANVLREYFKQTKSGWVSQRANIEIAKAGEKSTKAKASAQARWNKGKNANALPAQSEGNATQDTEHKTQDTGHKDKAPVVAAPDGVSPEVWVDFVKHRKVKRALINERVIQGIWLEADKAGWSLEDALKEVVLRNWQSFRAEWVTAKESPSATRFAGDI
jgi:uncharacterized protein YdaU (DUF1376 family)